MPDPTLPTKISRRAILVTLTASGAGLLLAACGGAAAPTSTTPASSPAGSTAPSASAAPATSSPAAASAAPAASQSASSGASAAGQDKALQAGFLPLGPGKSSPAPATAPKGQPKAGGNLRLGNLGDLPNLDGHYISGQNFLYAIWDRLVDLDASLNPHPALAESWDVNPDYTQVTLHLKKGVMFHNGQEFTSADVVWNYTRLKTDKKVDGGVKANFLLPMSSVEAPDRYTAVIKASQPWPNVFSVLAWCNILNPTAFKADPNKPVGTGPFSFVEWVQGDHIGMKKNPKYWKPGKPYVDQMVVQIFKDPQSMLAQLQGGAIDVAILPALRDAVALAKDSKYQVGYNQASGSVNVIATQNKQGAGPTTMKPFRQALAYSMNRARWADIYTTGTGTPKDLPITPTNPAYDAAKDHFYTFDLAKAKSLVQQAGVSAPSLEVLYSSTDPNYANVLQIWQQDLKTIGVTLRLRPADPVTYIQELFSGRYPNLAGGASLFGQLQPAFFAGNAYFAAAHNWANFQSAQLTQITNAIATTTDPAKQKQAYATWVDYILNEAWVLPWSNTVPRIAATAKVQGMAYNMTEFFMPNDIWLAG